AAAPPPAEKLVTWVIAEADVNRKLTGANGAVDKETLIGALNASGVFHMDRPNAHFDRESKEWVIRLNTKMTGTITALIWDDKTVFARKHGLTETEESERKVRLFGLAPGVSASIGEIKSTVEGYCKTRGVDYFSVNVNANNRNNKFAIVVTKTNEDRDRLVGSGFGIIAGNGVIINTKPENEQERNDRKYGKQLQLAALPTNENAAALEECRQWIGAKSVQIPPNPYTETKGSVAIFEFETTQQVDMIINDEESRKVDLSDGKTRTLFRTWKKNGNAFERVQL
ncbi:hypothetical protein HDU98_002162, partial [Podochytrium sp. JEL0797]